jgi:hypothetical protein
MPKRIDFTQIIEEQRDLLGEPPRSFGFFERWHWQIKRPWWCEEHAPKLSAIYEQQQLLREEGTIVWGACVQVNMLLNRPGRDDCPGAVIYSTESSWSDELTTLLTLADRLFELKDGTRRTEDEKAFGKLVADERPRVMHRAVPQSMTNGHRVILTTVMFHRKHLPGCRMTRSYFPLLVHPDVKATLMVPSRTWPEDLRADWND